MDLYGDSVVLRSCSDLALLAGQRLWTPVKPTEGATCDSYSAQCTWIKSLGTHSLPFIQSCSYYTLACDTLRYNWATVVCWNLIWHPTFMVSFSLLVPGHSTASFQVLRDLRLPHLLLYLHCPDPGVAKVSTCVLFWIPVRLSVFWNVVMPNYIGGCVGFQTESGGVWHWDDGAEKFGGICVCFPAWTLINFIEVP